MEEQKKSKEVKMTPANNEGTEEKRSLSYEELTKAANSLLSENRYLKQQLQQASEHLNAISRLGYLLRIVEIGQKGELFSEGFLTSCADEIESIMTLPAEEENNAKEN